MSYRFLPILSFALGVLADPPFTFCTENTCQDCPVSISSAGSGYPDCVIYNSDDVFPGNGFSGSDGGGWKVYPSVNEPDFNCQYLVRSPAATSIQGCGYGIASYPHATCGNLNLEKTFMVEFCCGLDDCGEVSKRSAKYRAAVASGSRGSVYLKDANGTIITPAWDGPAIAAAAEAAAAKAVAEEKTSRSVPALSKRSCDENSWVADSGRGDYTKPADRTQIVLTGVSGPAMVTITKERSQSFTTSLNLGIADILSLGIGFEVTEEMSESKSRQFQVLEGQTGDVGFTPYLRCSSGTGTCNGGQVHGEVCTPYNDQSGSLAGIYAVVQRS